MGTSFQAFATLGTTDLGQLLRLGLLIAYVYIHQGLTQASRLIQLNDCICPGFEVSYQCTVCGEGAIATEWTGSLFDCTANGIILRHSRFEYSSATTGECNNGAVTARSIGVLDVNGSRCYSSQLSVIINSEMNNKTVTCHHIDRIGETVIDTLRINITTESVSPRSIYLTDIFPLQLTFGWNQSFLNCPAVNYLITYCNDCGIQCPNTTTNTTTNCTDVIANGQECSLFVQTEVCGNITGKKSSPLTLTLKVPDPPMFAFISYSQNNKSIDIIFDETDSFNIFDGIDVSATSYTIVFSDSSCGFHCGSAVIPASECRNGRCLYSFEVQTSPCANSTNVSVTAYSTNVLGNGLLSRPFYVILDDCRYLHIEDSGHHLTLVIGLASLLALVLVLSSTIIIAVTVILVRSKTKIQRELQQARDTIRRMTSVEYEEIDMNAKHSHVPTQENVAYGHVCL